MTERELQDAIVEVAQLRGWLVAHFRPAMTGKGWRTPVSGDGKGFPDLVLARGRRLMFIELKSKTGKTSHEQALWLEALGKIGGNVETHLWKPEQWHLGLIEAVLA